MNTRLSTRDEFRAEARLVAEAPTEVFPALTTDDETAWDEPESEPEPALRRRGPVRRLAGWLVSAGVSLLGLAVLVLVLALTVVPAVTGAHTLTVLSGSMVPTLPVGSVVVDRAVDASTLRLGDIITYATTDQVTGDPILITHRIVAIDSGAGPETVITRGDANDVADTRPVSLGQIRGRLWYHVPYVGLVRNLLLTKGAGYLATGVALLALAAWLFVRSRRPDENEDEDEEPASDITQPIAAITSRKRA